MTTYHFICFPKKQKDEKNVIGSDVHTSVYDKRDAFECPIVNFLWLSVMFPDSHRMVFTFLNGLDLLGVALAFWISILKIFKLLPSY